MRSLAVMLSILILKGCAHVDFGKYCEGQFQTEANDSNFIKLNPPEPEDRNPKLDAFRNFWCSRWEKHCEWRCLDEELCY
jgi:hypothetical protein